MSRSKALATGMLAAGIATSASVSAQESTTARYAEIPGGAYSIVAQVRARPGEKAELRAAGLPLIQLVRSDPKNLVYFLQEDRSAPGHFIFYEAFASHADFEAQYVTPYVKAWLDRRPELAQGGAEVMRMEVLAR